MLKDVRTFGKREACAPSMVGGLENIVALKVVKSGRCYVEFVLNMVCLRDLLILYTFAVCLMISIQLVLPSSAASACIRSEPIR